MVIEKLSPTEVVTIIENGGLLEKSSNGGKSWEPFKVKASGYELNFSNLIYREVKDGEQNKSSS